MANLFLAEDRVMCSEIICKQNSNYTLSYRPGAICLTDPPLKLTDLVRQRRRWANGSMFASLYLMQYMCRVGRRKGSLRDAFRKVGYWFFFLYMAIQIVLNFVLIGAFYAAFSIFARASLDSADGFDVTKAANLLENMYLLVLLFVLFLSNTVNIKWAETAYHVSFHLFNFIF